MLGQVIAPNLTAGEGGISSEFSNKDWVKAIRHGVNRQNKGLLLMPSEEYYHLSNQDLAAMIAYLKQLPKVDNQLGETSLRPLGRFLVMQGELPIKAEKINHNQEHPGAPPKGATKAYGAYLGVNCQGCHGKNYAGQKIPGAPPTWPKSTNITPHPDGIGEWTINDFKKALREGRRPDGSEISEVMPAGLAELEDWEVQALWSYLQDLPPVSDS